MTPVPDRAAANACRSSASLTGKLLNAVHTAGLVERLYPIFDQGAFYGRGVMLYTFTHPQFGSRTWIGHSGGSPGIKAAVVFSPRDQAFVAVALTGDGSAEACVNRVRQTKLTSGRRVAAIIARMEVL